MRDFMRKADGKKDMGGIQGARGTGRTAGSADAFHIKHDKKGFPFHKAKAEIHVVWKPSVTISVQAAVRDFLFNLLYQIVSQFGFLCPFLFQNGKRPFGSAADSKKKRQEGERSSRAIVKENCR